MSWNNVIPWKVWECLGLCKEVKGKGLIEHPECPIHGNKNKKIEEEQQGTNGTEDSSITDSGSKPLRGGS